MAVLDTYGRSPAPISVAQTGNADSTHTAFRDQGEGSRPAAVVITSAIGATPTVTVNILASVDGVNFFNVPYALVSAPTAHVVAALTITTAVTTTYLIPAGYYWKYLKLNYSANTNVTLTATVYT